MSGRRNYVQWLDWREWQDVHAALFSQDVYVQQRALSRVAAWRSRAQLPVAISATVQLVEIQLHEQMADHHHHGVGVASRSHMELSLQYASAIVRCVNGLVDSAQKGTYAMAVSGLAQRIGIPLWIVDLRHESTHNQMPSLPVLRFAAQHLLAWLRSNYWYKQEELLRTQVLEISDLLQANINKLLGGEASTSASTLSAPSEAKTAPEATETANTTPEASPGLAQLLDADKMRFFVVPLLVSGEQFGERIAATGLLFSIGARADNDANGEQQHALTVDEQMARYPRDALIPLLLELQSAWRSFSASLVAQLCRKVFQHNDASTAQEEEEVNDDEVLEKQRETEICLLWIKYLVANEWREKLKFAAEPVDDLYQAGAEMLCKSEELKPTKKQQLPQMKAVFERLQAILKSCKGIRTHPLLGTDAAVNTATSEAATAAAAPWTQLPGWNECPLGLRYAYSEIEYERFEYPVELDGLGTSADAFARGVLDDGHSMEDVDEDADARMDAAMQDLDATYDQTLREALALKETIVQQVVREGQSAHQKLLPQEELQRIQSEIEIW
uniref:Las1-like protein n=1 Tax=Globisporangium ultimum (strain ATCC 200006 / CBS 805.95 / DAOM BR144) TaxID=431595 RepID=K3WIF1_GLOUD